jgi:MFS family permease
VVKPGKHVHQRAQFRDVFASGEWRAIWLAYLLSVAGDQLAKVALTVLVYERTGSPLWTALTYALTYLPWVIGGLWLSGLADRYPRRTVMITCDLVRMVLVTVMALPWTPLVAMAALLFVVTTFNGPFNSARSAERAAILTGEQYTLGVAVSTITTQIGTVAGFAGGGAVVAALSPRWALAIDAATFAASATLLRTGVRARPAPVHPAARQRPTRQLLAGARLVFGNRHLRTAMLLGWLMGFYTVPEALAVPYAARLGGGAIAAGLVFAAGPAGNAVGSAAFGRLVSPRRRAAWTPVLAVSCCGVLGLCALRLNLAVSLAVFAVSGALGAYQVTANAAFMLGIPDNQRGQAYGLASTGLQVSQGVAYIVAGAAAFSLTPGAVIAVMGATGAAVALLLSSQHRLRWPAPDLLPLATHCVSPLICTYSGLTRSGAV